MIREDLRAVLERDPAVRGRLEVILTHSGFHAVLWHRLCHVFWRWRLRLVARFLAMIGRFLTGVEIHPAARIGRGFFIDHGSGVVIGETSEIGDDVTLYHQVTLGGIAPAIDSTSQAEKKRHPTLEDGVIVGSGAQILGPVMVKERARVGANAVVVKDVEAESTVVGIPAKAVKGKAACHDQAFTAYGTPPDGFPDPVPRAMEGIMVEITRLNDRLCALEQHINRDHDFDQALAGSTEDVVERDSSRD